MKPRRRGRGEGGITERADGRWMGRVDLGWRDGQRQRKSFYGRTRREVAGKLTKALRDVQQAIPLPNERRTVAEYLSTWLALAQPRVRPRTFSGYQQILEAHVLPGLGRLPLARLSPDQVAAWFETHRATGVSPSRIRYARTVLRAALNHALRWSLIIRNPAALVEPPRHTPRPIQPLSPEQARALLAAAAGHRLAAFVSVALALGLRLGEALGLRWADVDLNGATLRVTQALQRIGGDRDRWRVLDHRRKALIQEWRQTRDRKRRLALAASLTQIRTELRAAVTKPTFVEPKSARSRRTIALPTVVVDALRTHRTRQLEERLAAGGRWHDHGLVFATTIGTPLDPRNITRDFKALLEAAQLPPIRIHDTRHTAATLLLSQGVDPRTIMSVLGHSQVSLTLNTYAHVLPTLQRDAAARMDAILRGS